jgi:acyl carrier protein
VAQGYLRRPELTAERFTTFANERVYRTGDRVRRLPGGAIEFLGRADDQVKVRGYRVELGEIALAIRTHAGVREAEVVVRPDDSGEAQVVAYVVPAPAGYATSHSDRATSETIRAWLTARLPEYMVPSAVLMIDAMPLTANGKVDRAKLPAPDAVAAVFVEPRTDMERKLAAIWAQVLKKERVGVTDDFLALGGHSLLAIRILGKISQTFGVRLSLRSLFDAPTVEKLAELLDVEKQLAALDALADPKQSGP